ncbi:hypothetical protein [Aeromonas veronii]|uniref:hypothetical protein n=1 Tax=Aeromonas veronii TaxID=654 RepID=UPI003D21AC62
MKEEFKRNAKHDAEAAKQGLTIIGKGKNSNYRLYRFNQCGHEQEFQVVGVRIGCFMCSTCQRQKLDAEAAAQGLTIVGNGKNFRHRLYRFGECGHEQEIRVDNVRDGKCMCSICQRQKLDAEAAAQGLTIVGNGKNCLYRAFRCLECSHEQEFQVGNVRYGNCICSNCGAYSGGFDPTKVGSCYLYRWEHPETKHSFLKFGITNKEPDERVKRQSHKTTYKPFQLVAIPYPIGETAKALENALDAFQKVNGGCYMPKEDFGDGYTETMSVEHEQSLKDIISEYCFGLIGLI